MFSSDNYIERNAKYSVRNAICYYLWEGHSLEESIRKQEEHISEYSYCDTQKYVERISAIFESIHTVSGLKSFLMSIQECYVAKMPLNKCIKEEFGEEINGVDGLLNVILAM